MSSYDEDRHSEINQSIERAIRHLQDMQQELIRAMRADNYEAHESRARMAANAAIDEIEDVL
jgi:hypothetical protein